MRVAVDTNVILRHALASDPLHDEVRRALEGLTLRGWELCICAQNVIEFWVVATRPTDVNGLGLGPRLAGAEVDVLLATYTVLAEPADLLDRWLGLCTEHGVSGRAAHDTRLAALMLSHEVRHLVTFNTKDFARYHELTVVAPAASDVLGDGTAHEERRQP